MPKKVDPNVATQNELDRLQRNFRVNLRHNRQVAGVSQNELARRTGCAQAYVAMIESGGRAPGLVSMARLSLGLKMDMVELLETEHLDDHLAALDWLKAQSFIKPNQIATGGNSFGGIVAVLGAERNRYCAAVDAAGGASSWSMAPRLRTRMMQAVRNSQSPILFFQAANDYTLAPSRTLSEEMLSAGKITEIIIYPAFGKSAAQGHSFAWQGSSVWAADVFQFLHEHCVADHET